MKDSRSIEEVRGFEEMKAGAGTMRPIGQVVRRVQESCKG
jgi:hypothetical protein